MSYIHLFMRFGDLKVAVTGNQARIPRTAKWSFAMSSLQIKEATASHRPQSGCINLVAEYVTLSLDWRMWYFAGGLIKIS